jgi:hypothetical protein
MSWAVGLADKARSIALLDGISSPSDQTIKSGTGVAESFS